MTRSYSISRQLSFLIILMIVLSLTAIITLQLTRQYRAAVELELNAYSTIEENIVPVLSYLLWVLNEEQSIQLVHSVLSVPGVAAVELRLANGEIWFSRHVEEGQKTRQWPLRQAQGMFLRELGTLEVHFFSPWRQMVRRGPFLRRILPDAAILLFLVATVTFILRRRIIGPLRRLRRDIDRIDLTKPLPSWWRETARDDPNQETRVVRQVLNSSAERVVRAIEERTATEAALAASLEEKNILLKEVHHRVKNNLQIVNSLLSLQRRGISNAEAISALSDSENRVLSMALVHELLYQSENLSSIDLGEYIRHLSASIVPATVPGGATIRTSFQLESLPILLDQAIPLGLITTELLTNAIKHAFPERSEGTIEIRVCSESETIILEIADDGIGMDHHILAHPGESLGMLIVDSLSRQLEATIEHRSDRPGTAFRFAIPNVGGIRDDEKTGKMEQ